MIMLTANRPLPRQNKNEPLQSNMYKPLIILALTISSCSSPNYKDPHVIIHSDFGKIEVELYPQKAPHSVAAFVSYINKGLYKNSSFYRVLKAEDLPTDNNSGLIQGGIYLSNTSNIQVTGIPHESTQSSGLSHTDGIVSLARTEPGTATTEFFICIGDQSSLDHGRKGTPDGLGMAAFGKIYKGMNIVKRIQSQKSKGDIFEKRISISNIKPL